MKRETESHPSATTTEKPGKQSHGQNYPGVPVRASEGVRTATVDAGCARRCIDQQVGGNIMRPDCD